MSVNDDDKSALGKLGRQEILTFLMIAIFGGFVIIVYTIVYLVLSNPEAVSNVTITGAIDLGVFVERFDETLKPHPAVEKCVSRLIANPMTSTLAEATSAITISRKHLVELFKRHVGPTPKILHRILRFASIAQHLQMQEPVAWAAISLACGYVDQSHLIKDFAQFSGYKPREFLLEGHDRLNFFPVDRQEGFEVSS